MSPPTRSSDQEAAREVALALIAQSLRGEGRDPRERWPVPLWATRGPGGVEERVERLLAAFDGWQQEYRFQPDEPPFTSILCSPRPLVCGTPHLRGALLGPDGGPAVVLFSFHREPTTSDKIRTAAYARGAEGRYYGALRLLVCLDERDGTFEVHRFGGNDDADAGEDYLDWRSCLDVWRMRGGV